MHASHPGRRSRQWLRIGVIIAALVLVLAYTVPSVLAARALTTPERHALSSSPSDLGLPFEAVEFSARGDDVTLRGWWIPSRGPETVILVHGRNAVRDDPEDGYLSLAGALVRAGYHVLMFDLRGHGESSAAHFGLGAREWRDVLGAVDASLARGVPAGRIAVIGFSSGAAAALAAAVREPAIGAVVADGVWPDLRELLEAELPRAGGLPAFYAPGVSQAARLLYGIDIDAAKPIDDVAALASTGRPMLLIHEAEDRYTNRTQAERLDAAAASERSETWWVEGAPHVQAYALHPDEYLTRVLAVLDPALGTGG